MTRIAINRYVTGWNEAGTTIIEYADQCTNAKEFPAWPELYVTELWATDEAPADNQVAGDRAIGAGDELGPKNGGTIFRLCQLPPDTGEQLDAAELFATLGDTGVQGANNNRHATMHETRTIDYITMIRGEVTLIMEEGEVVLKAGDCAIQRGTNHAWVNRGTEPCLFTAVLIDALPLKT